MTEDLDDFEDMSLKDVLRSLGLTQRDLARIAETTPGIISAWQTGRHRTPGLVRPYLKMLQKHPEELAAVHAMLRTAGAGRRQISPRDQEIYAMRLQKVPFRAIGERYGISTQAAHQIYVRAKERQGDSV